MDKARSGKEEDQTITDIETEAAGGLNLGDSLFIFTEREKEGE